MSRTCQELAGVQLQMHCRHYLRHMSDQAQPNWMRLHRCSFRKEEAMMIFIPPNLQKANVEDLAAMRPRRKSQRIDRGAVLRRLGRNHTAVVGRRAEGTACKGTETPAAVQKTDSQVTLHHRHRRRSDSTVLNQQTANKDSRELGRGFNRTITSVDSLQQLYSKSCSVFCGTPCITKKGRFTDIR